MGMAKNEYATELLQADELPKVRFVLNRTSKVHNSGMTCFNFLWCFDEI